MARLQDLIGRGLRADQPTPGTGVGEAPEGAVYYVADEFVTERSTGSTWEDISDSGAGLDSAAVGALIDAAIADLVDSSPGTLDTLNELAAALGDDPAFAASVATALGTKVPTTRTITAGSGLTGGGDLSANRTLAVDFGETGDIVASAPGDTAAAGATGEVADAGHRHAREAAASIDFGEVGDISSSAPGDTVAAGSTGEVADAGHRHAREAAGVGGAVSPVVSAAALTVAAATWR